MYNFCKIEKCPKITALYTGFSKTHKSGYVYKGETHDFWEIVFVLDGKLQVTAGEHIFVLEGGQAIVHNPMQFHALNCSKGTDVKILVFSFAGKNIPFLQDKVYNFTDMSEILALYELSQKAFLFDDICFCGYKGDKSEGNKFVKSLELLIMQMANNLSDPKEITTQAAKNYNAVIKVLDENIDKRLSVSQIAKLCNMSAISLQKTFSRFANMGVMEYFNRIKIKAAKKFFEEGLSVKEVAMSLGFEDPNYFSTVFKRITGNSPNKVRKKDK